MYLEKQALVVLMCNIIIFMLLIVNVIINTDIQAKILSIVFIIIVIIPLTIIQTYSINCMMTGNCNVFSWTLALLLVLCTIFYIIYLINNIRKEKRIERPLKALSNDTTQKEH